MVTLSSKVLTIVMVLVDALIIVVAVSWTKWWGGELEVMAIAIPLISLVTFGLIYLDTGRVRHGIAISIFLTYSSLLGLGFYSPISDAIDSSDFLTNIYDKLPWAFAAVISFYFGADAAERIGTRSVAAARNEPDAIVDRVV